MGSASVPAALWCVVARAYGRVMPTARGGPSTARAPKRSGLPSGHPFDHGFPRERPPSPHPASYGVPMLYDPVARRQAGRYVAVGLSGYAVQVSSFAALVHVVGLDYRLAGLLAGLLALVNNFVLNRQWTFQATQGHVGRQAVSYAIISAVFFAVQLGVLHVLVTAGVPDVPAEALSILAVVPANFLAQRRFSFGPGR